MQLPTKRAGNVTTQRILEGREHAALTRGAARYLGQSGQALLSYFRHELEGSNRVYERMEQIPGYVQEMQESGTFRLFPRAMISKEMELWIVTYGPFAISVTPTLHEKGYREQKTAIAISTVQPDHLAYLLDLSDENSITAVTQPPRLTRTVLERTMPHVSLSPFVLIAAKGDYRHRFPTAVVSAMHPKPVPEDLDYQQMTTVPIAKLLSERLPSEDDYRRVENDTRTGFSELLDVLGVDIKGLTESDRSIVEMYSKEWKLPSLE